MTRKKRAVIDMKDVRSLWKDEDMAELTTETTGEKMRSKKDERYDNVVQLMRTFFERAEKNEYPPVDAEVQSLFDQVFSSNAWGFREILMIVVIARLLNPDYKASVDFYACNPRPLFEQPIIDVLAANKVPSRLSGGLNMAKSTEKLNNQWAAGRRKGKQRELAYKLVPLIERIDSMAREELEDFATYLHARFLKKKEERELLAIEARPEADPMLLYRICQQLIDKATDVGNTPQKIVGFLLEAYHETLQTGIVVSGHEDRASTTNTTSKKIGDITEKFSDDDTTSPSKKYVNVYEVSVKPFNEQRAREAYIAVKTFDEENSTTTQEIIVICRESDSHPEAKNDNAPSIYLGKLEHQDLVFHFVNIYAWIMAQLTRMPAEGRLKFYNKLNNYIQDRNTSTKVLSLWKELHVTLF